MDSRKIGSEAKKTPSFVRPFLYALNRMQSNEILRPAQYLDRVTTLLVDRLGLSGTMPSAAFSGAAVGVMADHTHYFDGFALLLRIRQGVAVAIRPSDHPRSRIILEGVSEIIEIDATNTQEKGLSGLVSQTIASVGQNISTQYDIAIVGGVPTGLGGAFHAAYCVSLVKALHAMHDSSVNENDIRDQSLRALNAWYGHRFSPAYVIGSLSEQNELFILVDTGTLEHLPIEVPTGAKLGWGIVEWSRDWLPGFTGSIGRTKTAARALSDLQKNGFPNIESLRDLAHKDLDSAIDAVPRRSRSMIRYLVTENRNVQKLVQAIKKSDWQFFGALMMISQASKLADSNTTEAMHELVTMEAETASLEGIFGAVQSGEGKCMVVVGQPFSLPAFLDKIRVLVSSHTSDEVETFIV